MIVVPDSASFWMSVRTPARSASPSTSAAIAPASALTASSASVSRTKRSRASAEGVVSMRSAARPRLFASGSGRLLAGDTRSSMTSVLPSGTRPATAKSARRGSARSSCAPRTTTTRREPRNGNAETAASIVPNEATSVATNRSRLRSRSSGGNAMSTTAASARSAKSRSMPSITTSFPIAGRLSKKS